MTNFILSKALSITAITCTLFAFNAAATSPPHPDGVNQSMIAVTTYTASNYQTDDATKMYPAPEKGLVQHILTLPKLDNESLYKVEIEIGQTQMVDCNKHGLRGELNEHTIKGWGYNYYQVDSVSEGPSTMMACLKMATSEQFVRIPKTLMLDYDSRLPKIFYLPTGTELRFRTWRAESQYQYSGK